MNVRHAKSCRVPARKLTPFAVIGTVPSAAGGHRAPLCGRSTGPCWKSGRKLSSDPGRFSALRNNATRLQGVFPPAEMMLNVILALVGIVTASVAAGKNRSAFYLISLYLSLHCRILMHARLPSADV